MEEEKNIENALEEIRKNMKEENIKKEKTKKQDNFILLDKIVSKKKANVSSENINSKKNVYVQNNKLHAKQLHEKKIITTNKINQKKEASNNLKNKDPINNLVDREIRPIIQEWINKNLKSFVKTIVIEEMKLISKATQKPK